MANVRFSKDSEVSSMGLAAVVYDRKNNNLLVFNEAGAMVLKYMDGLHSINQIADIIASHFDIDNETVQRDVEQIVKLLSDTGLTESYEISPKKKYVAPHFETVSASKLLGEEGIAPLVDQTLYVTAPVKPFDKPEKE